MYSCANLPNRGLIFQNWVVFWKFYPKSLSFTCMTWWQWRSRCWGQHQGYWPNLETIWRGHQRKYNRKRIDKLRREKYDPWKISGIPNLEEGYYGKGNIRVNKTFPEKNIWIKDENDRTDKLFPRMARIPKTMLMTQMISQGRVWPPPSLPLVAAVCNHNHNNYNIARGTTDP